MEGCTQFTFLWDKKYMFLAPEEIVVGLLEFRVRGRVVSEVAMKLFMIWLALFIVPLFHWVRFGFSGAWGCFGSVGVMFKCCFPNNWKEEGIFGGGQLKWWKKGSVSNVDGKIVIDVPIIEHGLKGARGGGGVILEWEGHKSMVFYGNSEDLELVGTHKQVLISQDIVDDASPLAVRETCKTTRLCETTQAIKDEQLTSLTKCRRCLP